MSVQFICDCCGEQIYRGQPYRVVEIEHYDDRARRTMRDRRAHYHEDPCWDRVEGAIATVERDEDEPAPRPGSIEDLNVRRARWTDRPAHERERMVLETIGDRRPTNRSIWEAIRDAHPDAQVYPSDIVAITRRLCASGELVSEREVWRGRTRNRYHRRTDLDGPIADLDRAFRDDDEGKADA